jgi:succinylarginine dihydrolase
LDSKGEGSAMAKKAFEVNFDGLVGPTHSYAGLSYGNIASMTHRAQASNPREAALQGLRKAKALVDLGLKQGILPPQERPDIAALKRLGFRGTEGEILQQAWKEAPELLAACASASSMWTANAGTVSPSADSLDGKVHFTAANLNQKFHRAIESDTTTRIFKSIFNDPEHFHHHPALPQSDTFGDEGAANHTRFCLEYGDVGLQFFVYGRDALQAAASADITPKLFPARQTREASEAIARLHQLRLENTIFARQNSKCIDGGAFHNDVVAVGNQGFLFHHELAFQDSEQVVARLGLRYQELYQRDFTDLCVKQSEVPLPDAVKSYLFNSQLISLSNQSPKMLLVAPQECRETESVKNYLDQLLNSGKSPIEDVRFFNLRQSMQNGGGPACLRLRVVLNQQELAKTNPNVLLGDQTYQILTKWVETHYRDRLQPQDLADPMLLQEVRSALDELTQLLNLGSIYPFQI